MTTLSIAPREEQIELQGVPDAMDQAQLLAVPDDGDRKVELVFAPKSGPACSLSLFNGRFVEFRRSARRKGAATVYNLAFVDPKPAHDIDRALLYWGIASLGIAVIVAGIALQMWPLIAAGLAWASLIGLLARSKQRNRWVFYSRHGRIALFELHQSRADSARLEKLIGILAKRSQLAWSQLPPGKERLGVEIAEHRRLMSSGSISQDGYERAKRRIFARYKR